MLEGAIRLPRPWKQWDYPEMRFMDWEKRLVAFWHVPRSDVHPGDHVYILMGSGKIARFIISQITLVPNSKDALILQVEEDAYVKIGTADRTILDKVKKDLAIP